MARRFPTPQNAMRHIHMAIQDLLNDGWGMTGINPSLVRVFDLDSGPDLSAMLAPEGPEDDDLPPLVASACPIPTDFTGDVSDCCGAPLQQAGTCQVCTACGTTTGCS